MARDVDLDGPFGRAWLLKMPEDASPEHKACLASWLLNRPGAHPFWQWWLVSVMHLRDIPNVKPANRQYPEAEYEFMIYSIDPETCPNPEPDDPNGYPHLIPIDVVEQFHGVTDVDATRLCEGAVRAIVTGKMSPDQDYREAWKALIAGTVSHFREGKHAVS